MEQGSENIFFIEDTVQDVDVDLFRMNSQGAFAINHLFFSTLWLFFNP
jgi:hypothetical protein